MTWQPLPAPDESAVEALAAALGILPLTAAALIRRGMGEPEKARPFLDFNHYTPALPDSLPGIRAGTERLLRAIQRGETLQVYGGDMFPTALLLDGLAALKAKTALLDAPPDNGLTLYPGYAPRHVKGEAVVISRGAPPDTLPGGAVVISEAGTPSVSRLSYALMQSLYAAHRQERALRPLLDLLALGLLSERAPLSGDNRYWLQRGWSVVTTTRRVGLLSLIEVANIDAAHLTPDDARLRLLPRLFAVEPTQAIGLLTTRQPAEARVLASQVEAAYQKMRLVRRQIVEAAQSQMDSPQPSESALVFSSPHWGAGDLRAPAAQLARLYQRPVMLLSQNETEGGAETPTPTALGVLAMPDGGDSEAVLEALSDMLTVERGQVRLPAEDVPRLRRRLSNAVTQLALPSDVLPVLAKLPLNAATLELAQDLEKLAPFSPEKGIWARPIFQAGGVRFLSSAKFGSADQHRRLRVRDSEGREYNVIWWNSRNQPMPHGLFDLAYTLEPVFRDGKYEAQITLADWRGQTLVTVDRLAALDVFDLREALDLPALQAAEPGLLIWAEGMSERQSPGVGRAALTPCDALLVYTAPPYADIFGRVLRRIEPKRVYIHAALPPISTPKDLLDLLAGLLRKTYPGGDGAPNSGVLKVGYLAERCAQSEEVIRLGLAALEGRFTLVWVNSVTVRVTGENPAAPVNVSPKLNDAMRETAHYRALLRSAENLSQLVKNTLE